MTRIDNLRVLFQVLLANPVTADMVNWENFDKQASEAGLERIGGSGPDGMLVTKEQAEVYRTVMERPE